MIAALLTLAIAFPAADPFAGLDSLQGVWRAPDGRQVEIAGDHFTLTSSDDLSGCTALVMVRRGVLILDGERVIRFAVEGRWLRIGGTWFRQR